MNVPAAAGAFLAAAPPAAAVPGSDSPAAQWGTVNPDSDWSDDADWDDIDDGEDWDTPLTAAVTSAAPPSRQVQAPPTPSPSLLQRVTALTGPVMARIPGGRQGVIVTGVLVAAVVVGIVARMAGVLPSLPVWVLAVPVAAAVLWRVNSYLAGQKWRRIHKHVLKAAAAHNLTDGMLWSAPCQWLPTPGDANDQRDPFNGVLAVYDRGIAWFPAPVDDGAAPVHSKYQHWTIPAREVALVHRSRTGIGDGLDVHTVDRDVRCIQIPPTFLGNAVDMVQQARYRLLDD